VFLHFILDECLQIIAYASVIILTFSFTQNAIHSSQELLFGCSTFFGCLSISLEISLLHAIADSSYRSPHCPVCACFVQRVGGCLP
jgi:hypothetical protein